MTIAHARPRITCCRRRCAVAARHPEHHDRLLGVDSDPDALLELLEIAVTWHELDYTDAGVVDPADWLDFAGAHRWQYPDRAERAFSLALDIVGRACVDARATDELAEVIELVRG